MSKRSDRDPLLTREELLKKAEDATKDFSQVQQKVPELKAEHINSPTQSTTSSTQSPSAQQMIPRSKVRAEHVNSPTQSTTSSTQSSSSSSNGCGNIIVAIVVIIIIVAIVNSCSHSHSNNYYSNACLFSLAPALYRCSFYLRRCLSFLRQRWSLAIGFIKSSFINSHSDIYGSANAKRAIGQSLV